MNFSLFFIENQEKGWLPKFINEVRPKLFEKDLANWPRALEIVNYFKKIFENTDRFIEEYKELLPKVGPENITFSHNDI